MADKRIIVLEKQDPSEPKFNVALWAVVPVNYRQFYANLQQNFVSAFKGIDGA